MLKPTALAAIAALGLNAAAPAIAKAVEAAPAESGAAAAKVEAHAEAGRNSIRSRVGRIVPVLPAQPDEDASRIGWGQIRSPATGDIVVGKDKTKTTAHVELPPGAPVVAELYAGDPSRGWTMAISEGTVTGQRRARLVNQGNGFYALYVNMPELPGQRDTVTLVCTRRSRDGASDDTHELHLNLEAVSLDENYRSDELPPVGAASEEDYDDEHDADDGAPVGKDKAAAAPSEVDATDERSSLQARAALAFQDSIAFDTDAGLGAVAGVDLGPADQEALGRLLFTVAYRYAASSVRVVRDDGSQVTVEFPTHAGFAGGAWNPEFMQRVVSLRLGAAIGVAGAQGVQTGHNREAPGNVGVAGRFDLGVRIGGDYFAFILGTDVVISRSSQVNYLGGFGGVEARN